MHTGFCDTFPKGTAFDASQSITWNGWNTTLGELYRIGWEIEVRPAYNNWRDPQNSRKSHEKIYLKHQENNMLGRITKKKISTFDMAKDTINSFEYLCLDYLIQERNHRTRPPKIFEERGLTEKDIPFLLQLILSLQTKKKPKKKPTNQNIQQAEILLLQRTSR